MERLDYEKVDVFHELHLFAVEVGTWFSMQRGARMQGRFTAGLGSINLYATPEDNPGGRVYATIGERIFVASILTKPNLVIERLTRPEKFVKIESVLLYADFTASEARNARARVLHERYLAQKISESKYRELSELAVATSCECRWVVQKSRELRETAENHIKVRP